MPCAACYLDSIVLPTQPRSTCILPSRLEVVTGEGGDTLGWQGGCWRSSPPEHHLAAATARDLGQLGTAGHRQGIILKLSLALSVFVWAVLAFLTLKQHYLVWQHQQRRPARAPTDRDGRELTEVYGQHRSKYHQSQIIINYNNHHYTECLETPPWVTELQTLSLAMRNKLCELFLTANGHHSSWISVATTPPLTRRRTSSVAPSLKCKLFI